VGTLSSEIRSLKDAISAAGRTQTSVAVERLRADIVAGRLRPREKLRVQLLATRYGLAASALREALSRLVTDGLVDVEDQKGFRVARVSRDGLLDLTDTRVEIESLALRRAIKNGDVAWESGIVAAFHRLSRAPEQEAQAHPDDPALVDGISDLHRDFHASLISACRSEWLLYFSGLLYELSERYRRLALYVTPSSRNTLMEHKHLMETVIQRDATKACTLLDEHLRETTRIILATEGAFDG
jgi:DNA-binding GntR family transcriptional regulator